LETVFEAAPEIFSHNVECVERISRQVRAQSVWSRSLDVLKLSVDFGLLTKSSMMVGLGEIKEEVIETMREVVNLGVEIFTIGQYLQPTKSHLPVDRYVEDDEFFDYKRIGLDLGFRVVESGALVRSSYHADEQARLANQTKNEALARASTVAQQMQSLTTTSQQHHEERRKLKLKCTGLENDLVSLMEAEEEEKRAAVPEARGQEAGARGGRRRAGKAGGARAAAPAAAHAGARRR
jgi:hypothetical protein